MPPRSSASVCRAILACLAVLVFSGCALPFKRGSERPSGPTPTVQRHAETYLAPDHRELGRILSYDAVNKTAVIEISPFASPPPNLTGLTLVVRHPDTLVPSARLVASGRRTGAILGAYVVEGSPPPGHEVVVPPAP